MLRKMTEALQRITGPGAILNAWNELDRATSSVVDVEAQLRRATLSSSRHAA
jgi:hypothetical protein